MLPLIFYTRIEKNILYLDRGIWDRGSSTSQTYQIFSARYMKLLFN
jgi:hypothetical protein